MPNVKAPSRNQLRGILGGDNEAIRSFEQLFRAAGYLLNVNTYDIDTELTSDDFVALVDASSGAVTISTPVVSSIAGRWFFIKKIDNSGNAVTFNPFSSETVDGSGTLALSSQWDAALVANDGSSWFVLGTA